MNNYEYCTAFIAERLPSADAKVLDYGCGAGTTVSLCRARGIDAYGCDAFYEGGDYSGAVPAEFMGSVIRRMEKDRIPFDDNTFDWIASNQVLEHVPNLELVLAEMSRVLKPGGSVLSLFPDRGVWHEGHCGIPLLHRFPKKSRPRVYYGALMRKLGFGYHTKDRAAMEWSANFCQWLDDWTYYRRYSEIRASFHKYFGVVTHHEDDWLARRLGSRASLLKPVPRFLRRMVVRKSIGMVFVAAGKIRPAS